MTNTIANTFPSFSNSLIDDVKKNATTHSFSAGQILMKTGQFIKSTVLVLNGKIKVYREGEDGGEFLMYYLQPGQACAISMICAIRSEASQIMAKVDEDAELLMIPLDLMDKWMLQHRSWYEFVLGTYRSRFDDILEVVDNIAFRGMDERLEFHLKRIFSATGSRIINLSHQEIANELNTSREVISRLLKKMEQLGKVKLNRNQIEFIK
ncbi:Crp/Fnr family transcriptional regulator [Flavobacterium sp.]|uniref:Crp/Fnr family transcriptional regulator n=1 Tax=Flavobacterium sp. TaxID=239 RepID=UPI003753D88D